MKGTIVVFKQDLLSKELEIISKTEWSGTSYKDLLKVLLDNKKTKDVNCHFEHNDGYIATAHANNTLCWYLSKKKLEALDITNPTDIFLGTSVIK